jgi:phage portal protein BeeE
LHVQQKRFFAAETRSATGPLIALHQAGRPQWTPRNYAALASEGFAANAVGYRAVRMIAEAAGSLPWLLYEGDREVAAHPLLDLVARPNPGQPGREFSEQLFGFLLVAGNAYVEKVEIEGASRELHALRPDRVKAVASPTAGRRPMNTPSTDNRCGCRARRCCSSSCSTR